MNTTKATKTAAKFTLDQFEAFASQVKPFIDEAKDEVLGFFQNSRIGGKPRELAHTELVRAREEQKIAKEKEQDENTSREKVKEILSMYRDAGNESIRETNKLKKDHEELKTEIVKLAKAAGVDTKIHLENTPKVGKIDISFLTFIIRILRVKAEQSKSGKELVVQRSHIKATGMNAWVSGKQMKVHEQGTLQLQG